MNDSGDFFGDSLDSRSQADRPEEARPEYNGCTPLISLENSLEIFGSSLNPEI